MWSLSLFSSIGKAETAISIAFELYDIYGMEMQTISIPMNLKDQDHVVTLVKCHLD